MIEIIKYPRTPHVEGSRFQPGDHDLDSIPFRRLQGRHVVVEEKVDGANAALRFDDSGQLHLQSRGHFLTGGAREKHFAMFKQWAALQAPALWAVLGSRYVVYGEWLYAKHTMFYDSLPHYFLEFDVLDLETSRYLGTTARRDLLRDLAIVSVPVLYSGAMETREQMASLLCRSHFRSERWRDHFVKQVCSLELDLERAYRETDPSDLMEGLYIKIEEDGAVVDRFKFVRGSFLTVVENSNTHWLQRPIIPNRLSAGVDIWS
jgi:hypothetical protein